MNAFLKVDAIAVPGRYFVTERGLKDDSKVSGLSTWKDRVAIN